MRKNKYENALLLKEKGSCLISLSYYVLYVFNKNVCENDLHQQWVHFNLIFM